jgi:hypothetical protein
VYKRQIKGQLTINFTFDDKYFAPIDDEMLLCIPSRVEDLQAKLQEIFTAPDAKTLKEYISNHIKDFDAAKHRLEGASYFEI